MNSNPPLKIAHIDTGLGLRGGQRQLLMLAQGLRERGHDQTIVCLEGSDLEKALQQEGFPTFSLPGFDPWHAFGVVLWRQQLKSWKPQIIHAHDGRGQSLAWFASLGLPLRRVASRRVTFFPSDPWTYRLKYSLTCHAVVAVSENIRELSVQAGAPRERISVIPDGIEIPAALPSPAERALLRRAWNFTDDHFVVGLLGASTLEKGHDVALAAFNLLAEKLPQARLVIAGDESTVDERKPIGNSASDSESILRLGKVESLDMFFPGIDLFLMPSRSEGLGSSALWAMAYGVPVLASRVGGLPEIVIENQTGWLVPAGSPQALSDAIIAAAADRNLLARFSEQGRKRAEEFSAAIMVNNTEGLYYRLIDGKQH
jgi:glycosyltransferase involved in cell wall biosynthesis